MKNKNEKLSPKHVFLHLFSISMLYLATINVLTLIFQFINQAVRDPLTSTEYFAVYNSHNLVRFGLASIIIVFPLFIWSSWYLNKIYLRIPKARQMKTRKWLIYLTLFILALVVVGDLIRTIWMFLGGEISLRFILKALAVLIVSGGIFGYYLWDVRREKTSKKSKYFAWGAGAIVLILIVFGFILTGSPKEERLARFDYQKVGDLQEIQYQIINYWQSKEKLPEKLEDLKDSISGFMIPLDPQSKKPYEYAVSGENKFELCAEFNLAINDSGPKMPYIDNFTAYMNLSNWNHQAGRACFIREIDPELYPPFDKTK
ncbi:MAG: DUF5671 domain-containing protein [Candidatus Paceibacterota bacterium]|jgi:hypothetical protein